MTKIKLFSGEQIPMEMHKAKIVQKIQLVPVERRLEALEEAGYNTFLLQNKDVFLDMLTDSGVNAIVNIKVIHWPSKTDPLALV